MSHSSPPDERPWEQAGAIRRDSEPHRGHHLLCLAMGSLISSLVASLCLNAGSNWQGYTLGLQFLPGSSAGVAFALLARSLATRDLTRMQRNEVDPQGRQLTKVAHETAAIGIVANVMIAAVWAVWAAGTFLHWGNMPVRVL
jgi:hypothetical protein